MIEEEDWEEEDDDEEEDDEDEEWQNKLNKENIELIFYCYYLISIRAPLL